MNRFTSEITSMIRGDWEELRLRPEPWRRGQPVRELRLSTAAEIESLVRTQYGLTNSDIEIEYANGYEVDSFTTAAVLDAISLVDWDEVVTALERDRSVDESEA